MSHLTCGDRVRLTVLCTAAVLLVTLHLCTFRRVPTPTSDGQFYASIAVSVATTGTGIPSMFARSPVIVDHLPFYGPVYFSLAALPVRYFGVSPASVRITSLVGVWLMAAAAAGLAWRLTGSRSRALLAAVLLLLAPELGAANVVSTMHPVAVAFELLTLVAFAGAVAHPANWRSGLTSGVLLGLAVLTTPRTFPFAGAFVLAGLLVPGGSAAVRRQWSVALAACGVVVLVWAVAAKGGAVEWVRFMAGVLTREDRDVALLPFATRTWQASGSVLVTPLVAIGLGLYAARHVGRTSGQAGAASSAPAFLLLWTWMALVATMAVMNFAGSFRIYSVVPLFAVVLALPYGRLGLDRRVLPAVVILLLVLDAGLASVRWARIAATWDRRDPDRLHAFLARHVPRGSAVIGPGAPFFTAVEQSGSSYFHLNPESSADWARWVPELEPEALRVPPPRRFRGRYLVWLDREPLPEELACASEKVARFEPPPSRLGWLGPLGHTQDTGFEPATLYRLQTGCPRGYDPTAAAPEVVQTSGAGMPPRPRGWH
ncbi:MAG: hypothetical protein AB7I25_05955 [Vicinamibacterales bacterium]